MAEVSMRALLATEGLGCAYETRSAGLMAVEGAHAAVNALAVVRTYGMSLESHRARRLTEEQLAGAALVLAMTQQHKEAIARSFPAYVSKVYTLTEYAGFAGEIADPFGRNLACYKACLADLQQCIRAVGKKIRKAEAST